MRPSKTEPWEVGIARQWSPEMYRALGDPNRLTLLIRLATASGPLTVTQLADCCGVHISGVSRHLTLMREAGFLQCTREGRTVRYELDFDVLTTRLRGLADAVEACRAARSSSNDPFCHGDQS